MKFYKFISKRMIIFVMHNTFDGFHSISRHSFFRVFTVITFRISKFSWPEHHWIDVICRNAHLVHQDWYSMKFTAHSVLLKTNSTLTVDLVSRQIAEKLLRWLYTKDLCKDHISYFHSLFDWTRLTLSITLIWSLSYICMLWNLQFAMKCF
jgi:hypothetical protein